MDTILRNTRIPFLIKGNRMFNQRIENIILAVTSNSDKELIQEFRFNSDKKNELMFFFKPECFINVDVKTTRKIIEIAFEAFDRFEANVSGILVLSGKILDELDIMNRHYGYINRLSKSASQILSPDDYELMEKYLGNARIGEFKIYGGHEFLNAFTTYDEESLDRLWLSKKRVKLRSGFYFWEYKVDNQQIILINGFFPKQLFHYYHPSHKIILVLLQSNTNWSALKDDMIGDTYPEKAKPQSFRSEIYQNRDILGLKEVYVSRNFVHLSAGPFEAFFEIYNFLKDINVIDFKLSSSNLYRLMVGKRFNEQNIERALQNPTIDINNRSIDLFSITENKDSLEAISLYEEYFV